MRTRFVVAFPDPLSPEKEAALLAFIKERALEWWHPIPDLWLLVDPHGKLTPVDLRNQLQLRPELTLQCLVIQVPEGGQSAWFGPPPQFEWMLTCWTVHDERAGGRSASAVHAPAPAEKPHDGPTLRDQFKG
jgi:hypothetical protein